MKLFDNVYLLEGEVGGRPLWLPLLVGEWKVLLLDTGCASDVGNLILPLLAKLGLGPSRLSVIINTHCDLDHQGGNHALKQAAPQALLCCGDADREQIESPEAIYRLRYDAYRAQGVFYDEPTRKGIMDALGRPQPVDLTFQGGERLRLGPDWEVEILHLPGHSHGHLGVLDLKHRTLFGGDAIHGAVYLNLKGEPALCPTYLHVAAYRQTIRFIQHLDLDFYSGCHWPIKRATQIPEFCAESRDFVDRAERLLLEALRQPKTFKDLCFEVGPTLGSWPEKVNSELCFAFGGHLRQFETEGRINVLDDTKPRRYVKK
jgi:glyoxylase-like metal-dependent hydrolase (beta-lactamase superfamily II)